MHSRAARRDAPSGRLAEAAIAALAIIAFSLLVVGLHVRAYTTLSPIDELQHFDYAEKLTRGVLPRPGDRVGEPAMREEACRRIDANFFPPPCDSPSLSPHQFQEDGYATAAGQVPVYYAVAAVVGPALRSAVGARSLLTGMRLAGALWLAGGLLALWWALRAAGVARSVSASVVALVGTAPVVLGATAVMNPDAQLLLGGSLVLLAILRLPSRPATLALGAAAAVGVFVEETMLLAVGAAVIFCLVRAAHLRRGGAVSGRAAATHLAAASLALLGAALGLAAAAGVGHLIGGTDPGFAVPKNRQLHVAQVPWDRIAGQLPAMVTPVRAEPAAPALRTGTDAALRAMLNWALLGALVAGALFGRSGSRRAAVAGSTLGVMAVGGPAIAAQLSVFGHQFYEIPPRYGLPLLPGAALVLAASAEKRAVSVVLGVLAVVTVAVTIGALARA